MKRTTATALRANVLLFSVSIAIAIAPWFTIGLTLGLLDDGVPEWPWQGAVFLMAAAVMLLLRWFARRSFTQAAAMHKVTLSKEVHADASISGDCPHAWFVQLHLELLGYRCIG